MLLPSIFKNPKPGKRTSHAKLNEPEFACWTKETEWMDATMVMKDSIVVVVLSKRSILPCPSLLHYILPNDVYRQAN